MDKGFSGELVELQDFLSEAALGGQPVPRGYSLRSMRSNAKSVVYSVKHLDQLGAGRFRVVSYLVPEQYKRNWSAIH
jgi:hypothetical protein